jgi:hypothetical protein
MSYKIDCYFLHFFSDEEIEVCKGKKYVQSHRDGKWWGRI